MIVISKHYMNQKHISGRYVWQTSISRCTV
jgi:hypothetical protein